MVLPAAASGAVPLYDGGMTFQSIQGPESPEDYTWEVNLGEEQELRAVDDRHAAVYYTDTEHVAFQIEATPAHDAEGVAVPTTLAVTQPNVITLTVHHRSATFDYPVTQGVGWEGGFKTEPTVVIEPNREGPPPTCVVPDLSNRTLRASRRILHRAHCKLGRVRGERRREVRVTQQYRLAGRMLPVWTAVDVRAGAPGQYSRSS